ncbi:MAG TPA: diguanylate cyclase [Candidatus Sulfotelmatobacter sp.]|nr:diguanylate cyclase [Candidatus Sulfotelmatobacter sp.]
MLRYAPDAIALLDSPPADDLEARRFLFVNDAFERLYQCAHDEVVGLHPWDFFRHNARREGYLAAMAQLERGEPFSHTRRLPRPDGSSVWIEVNFRPLPPLDAPRCRWMFISRDISAARALQVQNQRLIAALERASEPIVIAAVHERSFSYEFVNDAFVKLTGYDRSELQYTIVDLVYDPAELDKLNEARQLLLRGEPVQSEFRMRRANGTPIHLEYTSIPVVDEVTKKVTTVVATFRDITESATVRRRLEHEASHDTLTGLFNRRYMERRLGDAAEWSTYVSGQSLLFIDLDHFKQVNDDFGHDVGDRVLHDVARALQSCVAEADVLGRWGGDEFLAILQCTTSVAERVAVRMIEALAGSRYAKMVGCSIGVARLDPHADVVALADEAAYEAKRAGGNSFRTAQQ